MAHRHNNGSISEQGVGPGLRGKLAVAVVLTVLIFLLLGLYADLGQVRASLFSFQWLFLPLILGLAMLNYFLRFFKWDSYLRALNVSLSRRESLGIFFAGLAMSVTPAKFGEVLKSFLIKQRCGEPVSRTAPIVFAERVTDFVALVVLALVGVASFQYGRSVVLVGLCLILICLGLIFQRRIWNRCIRIVGGIPRISKWAGRMSTAYESTLQLLKPKQLLVATGLSLPAWLAEGFGCYLVFRGLNVQVSSSFAVFLYSVSTLIGALTMLPGGIGGTEGSLAALAVMQGVSKPLAVSATFLIRLCTLWFAVLLGVAMLIWFQIRRKKTWQAENGDIT